MLQFLLLLCIFLAHIVMLPSVGHSAPPEDGNEINSDSQPLMGTENCQEIEYDLAIVQTENNKLLQQIIGLSESNKNLQKTNQALQNTKTGAPSSEALTKLIQKQSITKNQLNQATKKYNILIDEFEKRGEKIAELQSIIAKHDDKTRFFWFGAGAVVFFLGALAGKSGNRQKSKLRY